MSGKPVTPLCATDIIIEIADKIVLIERLNDPPGIAIPGGFIDVGESAEQTAVREAREETGLEVELLDVLGVYSDPRRDPRGGNVTTCFVARSEGEPRGGDDAKRAFLVDMDELPAPDEFAFDHARIIQDYIRYRRDGIKPAPAEHLARLKKPIGEV